MLKQLMQMCQIVYRTYYHHFYLLMKDQERQALNFEGKYNDFLVTLAFVPESESLNIQVDNTLTHQQYIQFVDSKFLSEREGLDCFRDPIDIFDYLSDSFGKAVVEEGVIKFVYIWGKVMKKERLVSIELVEQEKDEAKIGNPPKQILQRDAKIKQLELKLLKSQEFLKKSLEQKDVIIRKLELRLEVFQKKEQKYEETITQLRKKIYLDVKNDQTPTKIEKQYSTKIGHHPYNSHQQFYNLTYIWTNTAKILRQKKDQQCYNFINKADIFFQQKAEYSIKISKTTNKIIMIGFCTSAGLGNACNYAHLESAYYGCHGVFFEGGVRSDGLLSSGVGDVVQCEADLSVGVMRWLKNGILLKQCAPTQQMSRKKLHLSILMFKTGDQVELSVEKLS